GGHPPVPTPKLRPWIRRVDRPSDPLGGNQEYRGRDGPPRQGRDQPAIEPAVVHPYLYSRYLGSGPGPIGTPWGGDPRIRTADRQCRQGGQWGGTLQFHDHSVSIIQKAGIPSSFLFISSFGFDR